MQNSKEELLDIVIPSFLVATSNLFHAVELIEKYDGHEEMIVTIEDKKVVQGTAGNYINATLQSGLLSSRALMEFMGVRGNSKGTNLFAIRKKGERQETWISDFGKENGDPIKPMPLSILDKTVQKAWAHTYHVVNKSVAHVTSGPRRKSNSLEQFKLTSETLPVYVIGSFYDELPINKLPEQVLIVLDGIKHHYEQHEERSSSEES